MSPESIRREAVTRILTQVTNTLADLTGVIKDWALRLMTEYPGITEEEVVMIIIRRVARQDLFKELT